MIGKNEVENYMYVEWLEAREVIHAIKKRKKQSSTIREHIKISPRRLSAEAGSSDKLQPEKKEHREQKEDEEQEREGKVE